MAGRPSKYDPKYCSNVLKYMSKGRSKEVVASKLGISRDTLYEWCRFHPEFSDTIKVGEAKSLLFWEKVGIRGMKGQIKGFRPAVWIFVMKNRFGWRDIVEIDDKTVKTRQESQILPEVTLNQLLSQHRNLLPTSTNQTVAS